MKANEFKLKKQTKKSPKTTFKFSKISVETESGKFILHKKGIEDNLFVNVRFPDDYIYVAKFILESKRTDFGDGCWSTKTVYLLQIKNLLGLETVTLNLSKEPGLLNLLQFDVTKSNLFEKEEKKKRILDKIEELEKEMKILLKQTKKYSENINKLKNEFKSLENKEI